MATLLEIPHELRQIILTLAIWNPEPPPKCPQESRDRMRLRDDWGVWVLISEREPSAVSLLLACRTLHDDVVDLLASQNAAHVYELDVMFIPVCGLLPTWTCCPPPSQVQINTINVNFRIFDDEDGLSKRFGGHCSFEVSRTYPNPPHSAWNFYRLLASFLALGPQALSSPAWQLSHHGSLSTCRFTIRHLVISITSNQRTELDELSDLEDSFWNPLALYNHDYTTPYGVPGELRIFPGPGEESPYSWPRTTNQWNASSALEERLGLYLTNAFWALLDFGWLSRGFGLIVYEGILDDIEIWVDGERRVRYDLDDLLSHLPGIDSNPEDMAALMRWSEWVKKWRNKSREGVLFIEPRPSWPFTRYRPHNSIDWEFGDGVSEYLHP